jgi:hypothetical protein
MMRFSAIRRKVCSGNGILLLLPTTPTTTTASQFDFDDFFFAIILCRDKNFSVVFSDSLHTPRD